MQISAGYGPCTLGRKKKKKPNPLKLSCLIKTPIPKKLK